VVSFPLDDSVFDSVGVDGVVVTVDVVGEDRSLLNTAVHPLSITVRARRTITCALEGLIRMGEVH